MAEHLHVRNKVNTSSSRIDSQFHTLEVEFSNHVRLGQWELARSCATTLASTSDEKAKENLIKLLKNIAFYPEKASIFQSPLKSPNHLSWLCCQLLKELVSAQDRDVELLAKDAEFRVLLRDALPGASSNVLKELHVLYCSMLDGENVDGVQLSSDCYAVLKEGLLENPSLVSCLLNQLLLSSEETDLIYSKFQVCMIYLECLSYCIKQIKNRINSIVPKPDEVVTKILLILSLLPEGIIQCFTQNPDISEMLDLIFEDLVLLCANNTLEYNRVYGACLGRRRPCFLQHLCDKEDQLFCRRGGQQSLETTRDVLSLPSSLIKCAINLDGTLNHREALLQSVKRNSHFLETLLNTAVQYILMGQPEEAIALLKEPMFSDLKPIVLVLAWNQCVSDMSAGYVLDTVKEIIPKMSLSDPLLKELCQKLHYFSRVTDWCVEKVIKLHPNLETVEILSKARMIFDQLQHQSVLRVIHNIIGLKHVKPAEIINLLKDGLPDSVSAVLNEKIWKCDLTKWNLLQLRDVMIYKGYIAIQCVMDAIHNSRDIMSFEKTTSRTTKLKIVSEIDEPKAVLEQLDLSVEERKNINKKSLQETYYANVIRLLEKAQSQLQEIYPVSFRVEILENMFSLLFVMNSDIQDLEFGSDSEHDNDMEERYLNPATPNLGSQQNTTTEQTDISFHGSHFGKDEISADHMFETEQRKQNQAEDQDFDSDLIGPAPVPFTFYITTDKLKDSPAEKSRLCVSYSAGSSHSTSSSSLGYSKIGFLCDEVIVRDLLAYLRDSILDAKTAVFEVLGSKSLGQKGQEEIKQQHFHINMLVGSVLQSSVSEADLQKRLSLMSQYVSEAQWRFQLVSKKSNPNRIGVYDIDESQVVPMKKKRSYVTQNHVTSESWKKNGTPFSSDQTGSSSSKEEAVKHQQKLKQKRSTTPKRGAYYNGFQELGIIHRMLASPDDLLRYSLLEGNQEQAKQVIQLFRLQDSCDGKEVFFSENFAHALKKLNTMNNLGNRQMVRKVKLSSGQLSAVAEAAALGVTATTVMSLIEELLTLTPAPSVPEIKFLLEDTNSSLNADEKSFLAGCSQIHSIVCSDLAFTASASQEIASILLDQASKRMYSLMASESASRRRGGLVQVKGARMMTQQMRSLLTEISCLSETSFGKDILVPFSDLSVKDILSCPYFSLEPKTFHEQMSAWIKLSKQLSKVQMLLKEEESHGIVVNSNQTRKISLKEIENKLHSAFCKLDDVCSRDLLFSSMNYLRKTPREHFCYLRAFYSHVRQVYKVLWKCRNHGRSAGDITYGSYFSVLKEDPSVILRRMVLEDDVPPERLEEFAKQMSLDLVYILAQSCVPSLPLCRPNSIKKLSRQESLNYSVSDPGNALVLNNSSRKQQDVSLHPVDIAHSLITQIINIIDEYFLSLESGGILNVHDVKALRQETTLCNWIDKCCELKFVDLDRLETREQKLCFFTNVTNIAWMLAVFSEVASLSCHAMSTKYSLLSCCDVNHKVQFQIASENRLESLMKQKLVGIEIGQLGFISLFDLRYKILRKGLPTPILLASPPLCFLFELQDLEKWKKYITDADPRLLFVLNEGTISSPKLQALSPENLNDRLERAMADYLSHYVQVDLENQMVELPGVLHLFSEDFSRSDNSDFTKAHFEDLIRLVSDYLTVEKRETINTFLQGDLIHGFTENIDETGRRVLPFTLCFKHPSVEVGFSLQYINKSKLGQTTKSTTKSVLTSWDLTHTSAVFTYLKERCQPLAEFVQIIKSCSSCLKEKVDNVSTTPLACLLGYTSGFCPKSCSSFSDMNDGYKRIVETTLKKEIDREFIWNLLQSLISCQDFKSVIELIEFLDIKGNLKPVSELTLFQDLVLWQMAHCPPTENFYPWSFALQIQNIVYRVQCILSCLNFWPSEACQKTLQTALSDEEVRKESQYKEQLDSSLKKILLYQKIQTASKQISNQEGVVTFKSWQEVSECSNGNVFALLNSLQSTREYKLALEWAEIHPIPDECKMIMSELKVCYYLECDPPELEAAELSSFCFNKILKEMFEKENGLNVCERLLTCVFTNMGKVAIVEFLMAHPPSGMSPEMIQKYSGIASGLKMLNCVSPTDVALYENLVECPQLLLEQLLMNMEVEVASRALETVLHNLLSDDDPSSTFSSTTVNRLIEDYASKALDFPVLEDVPDYSAPNCLYFVDGKSCGHEDFIMPQIVPTREEWVPDNQVTVCMACSAVRFSTINRRHHCRRCGRVVCADCSKYKLQVEGYGGNPVKVCEDCYQQTLSPGLTSNAGPSSLEKQWCFQSSVASSSPRFTSSVSGRVGLNGRSRSGTVRSLRLAPWILDKDESQNSTTRREFFFEQAPNLPLCLSVLKLHLNPDRCADYMLDLCDDLFGKLKPKPSGQANPEVDYGLVISMMKSLLLCAKVKSLEVSGTDEPAEVSNTERTQVSSEETKDVLNIELVAEDFSCKEIASKKRIDKIDTYIRRLNLLKLLVTANCKHLIPSGNLTNNDTVRRLRDCLVKEERLTLALEVSTKYGLDCIGIWATWGMICLRGGDWLAAREKFAHCLKDKNQHHQENPLLQDIINVLENFKYPSSLKGCGITHSLARLKGIQVGNIQKITEPHNKAAVKECQYYLKTYGTSLALVLFYERNDILDTALNYILEKSCDPDVFIHGLLMPSLKRRKILILLQKMSSFDSTLSKWWHLLMAACRYLKKKNFFHVLYKIQCFMKDYIRAAMTSIQLFKAPAECYSILFERMKHLTNACDNFEAYLRGHHLGAEEILHPSRNQILMWSPKEVNRHISTISLQIDITKFLHTCSTSGPLVMPDNFPTSHDCNRPDVTPPTLFDNCARKAILAAIITVNGRNIEEGFGLAYRVIQDHHLAGTQVFSLVGQMLVGAGRVSQISRLTECLMTCGTPEKYDTDKIVGACIQELIKNSKENKDLESLIKLLKRDINKINAYLFCNKLKSAYLLAVRCGRIAEVKQIMIQAEKSGQEAVRSICEKWLQAQAKST
ncbi:zinc finger FYVE-type containing 26 spastizin isoform X2 [Tachypleus tridentatus]|uniref:zinc finger FYVE-type containing 26 spastizin isoform X2 n=1 Tax=Tachypleus tridentatus TaxID=6853 RepID=UPI003FCF48C1